MLSNFYLSIFFYVCLTSQVIASLQIIESSRETKHSYVLVSKKLNLKLDQDKIQEGLSCVKDSTSSYLSRYLFNNLYQLEQRVVCDDTLTGQSLQEQYLFLKKYYQKYVCTTLGADGRKYAQYSFKSLKQSIIQSLYGNLY